MSLISKEFTVSCELELIMVFIQESKDSRNANVENALCFPKTIIVVLS